MLSTTIRIQCLIILQLIHAYVHKNLKKSFRKKKKRTLILLLSKSYCWNILAFCLPIGFKCYIYLYNIYVHNIYIYIYPHICVLSFPGLISVARVNEERTTDVTRVLKAPGAEHCQNFCGVVNEQKIFCSHQCSPECLMNRFRA